jgi:hypothetical protein
MKTLRNDVIGLAISSFLGGVVVTLGLTTMTNMEKSIKSHEIDPNEYRFVVIDDSLEVSYYNHYIGTIKAEGALKEMIDNDNE